MERKLSNNKIIMERILNGKYKWCNHFIDLLSFGNLGIYSPHLVVFFGIFALAFHGFKVQKIILMESSIQ